MEVWTDNEQKFLELMKKARDYNALHLWREADFTLLFYASIENNPVALKRLFKRSLVRDSLEHSCGTTPLLALWHHYSQWPYFWGWDWNTPGTWKKFIGVLLCWILLEIARSNQGTSIANLDWIKRRDYTAPDKLFIVGLDSLRASAIRGMDIFRTDREHGRTH